LASLNPNNPCPATPKSSSVDQEPRVLDVGGTEALRGGELWAYRYLRSRANSIEGGTSDVLRNIVAERVLGLPKLR
jgi:hypothetical protein